MPLAELQRDFAHALLAGDEMPMAIAGRLNAQEALRVHRNTVLGALVNALRLAHPTVDALVGEDFFDQAAAGFAEAHPLRQARLALYGEGFADFLASWPPAACLPCLADVARLDFAIERALQGPLARKQIALDAAIAIVLPAGIQVLTLRYPADAIRAAIGDEETLTAVDLAQGEYSILVWRMGHEATVRRVDAAAGRFLAALENGDSAEAALAAAGATPQALAAIQADIFAAPFCTVISISGDTP